MEKEADLASGFPDFERLDRQAALALIRDLAPSVPVDGPREETCCQLIEKVQGLPIAVEILGRQLQYRATHGGDVDEFLGQLLDKPEKFLPLEITPGMKAFRREQLNERVTLHALFAASIEPLKDEPEMIERYGLIGHSQAVTRPHSINMRRLKAGWHLSADETEDVVNRFVDLGLLKMIEPGRCQIHELLKEFAKTLI